MRHLLTIVSLAGLAACAMPIPMPAPAPAPAPAAAPAAALSAKERFVTAVEANGCVMNASNLRVIMEQATVGTGDLENIVVALTAEGRAVPDGSNIRLVTPSCTT